MLQRHHNDNFEISRNICILTFSERLSKVSNKPSRPMFRNLSCHMLSIRLNIARVSSSDLYIVFRAVRMSETYIG